MLLLLAECLILLILSSCTGGSSSLVVVIIKVFMLLVILIMDGGATPALLAHRVCDLSHNYHNKMCESVMSKYKYYKERCHAGVIRIQFAFP